MFTGLIEAQGIITEVQEQPNLVALGIASAPLATDARIGESVAVNGVCLTVRDKKEPVLYFDLMKETLAATTLKHLQNGHQVNLERALRVGDRLGGHFVSGHVDDVVVIRHIVQLENYVEYQFSVPSALRRYLVPKGSVALDGVSLTVGEVGADWFAVYLIPHTLAVTTFGQYAVGDEVNIETDILAKYVLLGGPNDGKE